MVDSDIPAEAVEAVVNERARRWSYDQTLDPEDLQDWKNEEACDKGLWADLATAAPHIRADECARVLAKVDAALRAEAESWRNAGEYAPSVRNERAARYEMSAAFLRLRYEDMLGAEGGDNDTKEG
jgi:hypothetical protein